MNDTMERRVEDGRMNECERRLGLLEARCDSLAKREWVHEIITPIRDSVVKIEHSISALTGDMQALFKTQDELLREKAQRERELHEEQLKAAQNATLAAQMKDKWIPLFTFFGLVLASIGTLAGAAAWWIVHYVLPGHS